MDNDKLRECPFCGCKPAIEERDQSIHTIDYDIFVACPCGVEGEKYSVNGSRQFGDRASQELLAISSWNKRFSPSPDAGEVANQIYRILLEHEDGRIYKLYGQNSAPLIDIARQIAALSAIRPQLKGEEWIDIKEVPHNETVWVWNGEDVFLAHYSTYSRDEQGRVIGMEDEDQSGLLDRWEVGDEGFDLRGPRPVMWQPFLSPPPPSEQKARMG